MVARGGLLRGAKRWMRPVTKWEGELQWWQPCWGQIVTGDSETSCAFSRCSACCTKHSPETAQLLCLRHAKSSAASAKQDGVSGCTLNVSRRWVLHGDAAPASALHRGLGADRSPGEWQLSLPVWYLFIGASWVLKSLLWRDETHAHILRGDGSRAQPHLALFISLPLIYSLVFTLPEI